MAISLPPGTVRLTEGSKIILHPKPTDEYDDPLNWSARRKALHFGIINFYVAVTFSILNLPVAISSQLQQNLSMTGKDIILSNALNFAALGLGSIFLVPMAYCYGRRPIYLLSAAVQMCAVLWLANISTKQEYFVCGFVLGAGAAVTQTLIPITVADLFFVHQYATMNGWFLFTQGVGAFLGPLAASFIVQANDWRRSWWLSAGLLGLSSLLIIFLLEESTYVPTHNDQDAVGNDDEPWFFDRPVSFASIADGHGHVDLVDLSRTMTIAVPDAPVPAKRKTLRTRLALITRTGRPIKKRFLAPFATLSFFPAVSYAALTFGAFMGWLAIFGHIITRRLFSPPYNFGAKDVGLFELAPLIGNTMGGLVVPALSDRFILMLVRRKGGMYHPEMRLPLAILGAIFTCVGMSVFGYCIFEDDAPWMTLALGFGLFAFGLGICVNVALTYVVDCYLNVHDRRRTSWHRLSSQLHILDDLVRHDLMDRWHGYSECAYPDSGNGYIRFPGPSAADVLGEKGQSGYGPEIRALFTGCHTPGFIEAFND
ncbi:hypothetical protein QQS21_000672 [Conoideocrella luteorostrata]|uniref:Major facilitator superfamily transporter n=1 Tax=Conoideocrella luteorostrata TaxID=1105319 RepID=A0AAJ0FZ22_9HYPO|nr:hypothetical protein QQS21_000672 [Conoideocrella luteorostrata]